VKGSIKRLVAVMALAVGACGGGGGGGKKADVNEQAAKGNATTSINSSKTAVAGDGMSAAYQMSSLGTSALGLVTPTAGRPIFDRIELPRNVRAGVCECDADSCHFEACTGDGQGGTLTLDGDLSWGGGHVVANLDYVGDAQQVTYEFSVDMDVMITETTIDGTTSSVGSAVTQGISSTWNSQMDIDNVTFNAAGCPTAGSIHVDANVSYAGQAYTGTADITFDGTGC
jgi:hypothetical protein